MLPLVKRAGVLNATIKDIEKRRQLPAVDMVERPTRVLGVRPCWLAFVGT